MKRPCPYPPIADYALIGDCHSTALVSRRGSIDWCCLPRFDSDSCFARLLDWNGGGYFQIAPVGRYSSRREYLENSLVLVTTFRSGGAEARVIDFFAMRAGGSRHPRREIARIVEGVRGTMRFDVRVVPRLDFGEVKPWIRSAPSGRSFIALGSNTGLAIFADFPLQRGSEHDLAGSLEVRAGTRQRIALQFLLPQESDEAHYGPSAVARIDRHCEETLRWWRNWSSKITYGDGTGVSVLRSAIALKALCYAPTGAIVAAATSSLPERVGGARNWDYRFCWIRDAIFTVHALGNLGLEAEATGIRRFIERSSAGNADELQVFYAVDGKRRLPETNLHELDGWRGSRPVRIGNRARSQFQADMYGLVVELSWRWSQRGEPPDEHYWEFLVQIVEAAIARRHLPDRGIWEVRSRPLHFVLSKAMCWAAIDGGIALAERYALPAPLERWRAQRESLKEEIETRGMDHERGIFVRSYGSTELDASLLLLPAIEFVRWDDERMLRTTDAIRKHLTHGGLLLRYRTEDGLNGEEGVFVACTFWLVECLAHQGRRAEAHRLFRRACRCANDLGLFSEEFDPEIGEMLGNFPQGLSHLAHISAALALGGRAARRKRPGKSRRRRSAK